MSKREFTKLLLKTYGFSVKELRAYQNIDNKIEDEKSVIWCVKAMNKQGNKIDFEERSFELFIKNLIKLHLQKFKIKK